jgi:hypothetical protein
LIADINAHKKVLFTAHMGDIKGGSSWCQGNGTASRDVAGAADVYAKNLAYFNSFAAGVVYLPGDNEWTDCHRTNNGAYSPTERLAYLRAAGFFASNQSLGQQTITLTRQSSDAGFELYKENVMWRTGNIIFVGLGQPGSNNNHQRNVSASSPLPSDLNEVEYEARNNANIAWITKAFASANADPNTKGVVIMQQANVFERFLEPNQGYTRSGYEQFVITLRDLTVAFAKPVVLVGGDTHTVRIDKPMTSLKINGKLYGYPSHTAATGSAVSVPTTMFAIGDIKNAAGTAVIFPAGSACTPASALCVLPPRVQNFTRVEVFGSPDVAWIRVVVDPFDPNVFSFAMQTIPGTGHGRDGHEDDLDLQ